MASLNFYSGSNAGNSSYVRVGHNSSAENKDAVWSFQPVTANATAVTEVTFTLSWNNSSAGTGWSGSYQYAFAVVGSAPSGQVAASGTVLGRTIVTLSGSTGSTTFKISGLSLNPQSGYTYFLCGNFNGTTKSTMKAFSKTGNTFSVSGYTPSRTPSFNGMTFSDYIPEENAYYTYYNVENSDLVTSSVCKFFNSNNTLMNTENMISGSWLIGGTNYNYRVKYNLSNVGSEREVRQIAYVNSFIASTTEKIYPQKKLMLDGVVAGYFKMSDSGATVIEQFSSLIHAQKSCYWLDSWVQTKNNNEFIIFQHNQTNGDFESSSDYVILSMTETTLSLTSTYLPRQIKVNYPNESIVYEYDPNTPKYWKTINPIEFDGNGMYVDRTDYWYINDKAIYTNGTQEILFYLWDGEGIFCPPVTVSLNEGETGLYTLIGIGGPAYVKINNQIKRGTVYVKKGQELVPVVLK